MFLNDFLDGLPSSLGWHGLLHSDRLVTDLSHVSAELGGNFLENLLSQVTLFDRIVKLHELNNVTTAGLATRVSETTAITIELLHS